MSTSMRCQERFANNRAEVSHEHTREQERQMPRFQIATPGAVIRGCSQSGPQFVSHRAASSSSRQLLPTAKSHFLQVGAGHVRLLNGTRPRSCTNFVGVTLRQNPHYNEGRSHMSLGPGVPDSPTGIPPRLQIDRHRADTKLNVFARSVLGGLHHE